MRDQAGSFRTERVEESAQGGHVPARGRPHQPATVMVDNNSQILVATLVGDLINPDPPQVGERVIELLHVTPDPGDDRPHRTPRDPHQLGDRGLRRLSRQPGNVRVEVMGMPGLMPCPRNGRDRDTMDTARHSRRVGFQIHLNRPAIKATPAPPPTARVVSRTPTVARPAAVLCRSCGPDLGQQNPSFLVELDAFHNRFLDTEQSSP